MIKIFFTKDFVKIFRDFFSKNLLIENKLCLTAWKRKKRGSGTKLLNVVLEKKICFFLQRSKSLFHPLHFFSQAFKDSSIRGCHSFSVFRKKKRRGYVKMFYERGRFFHRFWVVLFDPKIAPICHFDA